MLVVFFNSFPLTAIDKTTRQLWTLHVIYWFTLTKIFYIYLTFYFFFLFTILDSLSYPFVSFPHKQWAPMLGSQALCLEFLERSTWMWIYSVISPCQWSTERHWEEITEATESISPNYIRFGADFSTVVMESREFLRRVFTFVAHKRHSKGSVTLMNVLFIDEFRFLCILTLSWNQLPYIHMKSYYVLLFM